MAKPSGTKALTGEISRRLEVRGVAVTVKHAVTTTSVYLDFDYGVLKKARVGDHKGRAYNFTYEIGAHVQPPYEIEMTYSGQTYTRHRYTPDRIGDLIQEVLIMRSNMWAKYGKDNYAKIVEQAKKNR